MLVFDVFMYIECKYVWNWNNNNNNNKVVVGKGHRGQRKGKNGKTTTNKQCLSVFALCPYQVVKKAFCKKTCLKKTCLMVFFPIPRYKHHKVHFVLFVYVISLSFIYQSFLNA